MALTTADLQAIEGILDKKLGNLEERLDARIDKKIDEKLGPIHATLRTIQDTLRAIQDTLSHMLDALDGMAITRADRDRVKVAKGAFRSVAATDP